MSSVKRSDPNAIRNKERALTLQPKMRRAIEIDETCFSVIIVAKKMKLESLVGGSNSTMDTTGTHSTMY